MTREFVVGAETFGGRPAPETLNLNRGESAAQPSPSGGAVGGGVADAPSVADGPGMVGPDSEARAGNAVTTGEDSPAAAPSHSYDFAALSPGEADVPMLSAYGGIAKQHGLSQDAALGIAKWHRELVSKQIAHDQAEYEAWDKRDEQQCRVILQDIGWIDSDDRAATDALATMPGELQELIENGILQNGSRAKFSPTLRVWLAGKQAALKSAHGPGPTRSDIQEILRSDPKKYFKDEGLQARYRQHLTHGDGVAEAPLPTDSAGVHAEIKAMNKLMTDRRSEYWTGPSAEKNQARYRELLRRRG